MTYCRLFLLLLLLAACGDRAERQTTDPAQGTNVILGDDRGGVPPVRHPLPDPPRPPAAREGALLPLSAGAIARELSAGAGCALDEAPPGPLLMAVAGDAILNDGGRIVHLKPDAVGLDQLMKGGRFVGDGIVIEIDREFEIEKVDGVTTWQASLRILWGKLGVASFHHRWSCDT